MRLWLFLFLLLASLAGECGVIHDVRFLVKHLCPASQGERGRKCRFVVGLNFMFEGQWLKLL